MGSLDSIRYAWPRHAVANAVFTTKVTPGYNDLPEIQYHFPRTYLRQAEAALGDFIVYYEPRREGMELSGRAGRQCYFAIARVRSIVPDPNLPDHFYAYLSDYLEFPSPVPFAPHGQHLESALRKPDGSTNKGAFGRSVRLLPNAEFSEIVGLGLSSAMQPPAWDTRSAMQPDTLVADPVESYGADRSTVLVDRVVRDAAFSRTVDLAYDSTCAFTGLRLINGGGRREVEAAHIRAVSDGGPDSPRNGLALSRTVHWLFDRGIISLTDDGEILTDSKHVPDPVRRMLNPDMRAILPEASAYRPHPQFLSYHREHTFKG